LNTAEFSAKPNQLSARAFTCVLTDGMRVLQTNIGYARKKCEMAGAFRGREARIALSQMAQAWAAVG
jgi:hypothetical protein